MILPTSLIPPWISLFDGSVHSSFSPSFQLLEPTQLLHISEFAQTVFSAWNICVSTSFHSSSFSSFYPPSWIFISFFLIPFINTLDTCLCIWLCWSSALEHKWGQKQWLVFCLTLSPAKSVPDPEMVAELLTSLIVLMAERVDRDGGTRLEAGTRTERLLQSSKWKKRGAWAWSVIEKMKKRKTELYPRRNDRFQLRTRTRGKQIGGLGRNAFVLGGAESRDCPGRKK